MEWWHWILVGVGAYGLIVGVVQMVAVTVVEGCVWLWRIGGRRLRG